MDQNLPPSSQTAPVRNHCGSSWEDIPQKAGVQTLRRDFPSLRGKTLSLRLVEELVEEEPPSSIEEVKRFNCGGSWFYLPQDAQLHNLCLEDSTERGDLENLSLRLVEELLEDPPSTTRW